MASDRRSERSALRGLLVPETGLTFDLAESTLTQAGARAGLPSPDRRTTTALVATGEQAAAFDVEIVRGGSLGTEIDTVGQYAYSQDGVAYGWDMPIVLRGWQQVFSVASASPAVRPSGLVRVGDSLVAATTLSSVTTFYFSLYRRTVGDDDWEDVGLSVFSGAVSPESTEPRSLGCLLLLPSGRVLAYYATLAGGGARWALVMTYSDDEGQTWSEETELQTLAAFDVEDPFSEGWSEILGICAAYSNGQVVLFVNYRSAGTEPGASKSRDGFIQYASTDLGQTFVQVAESNRSVALSWDCGAGGTVCVAKDGTILFAFVGVTSSVNRAFICRLGTAFSPFNTEEVELTDAVYAGTATSTSLSRYAVDWDCALVTDDNGIVWAYLRDGQEVYPFRSEDHGVTWLSQGVTDETPSIAHVYRSGNSDSRMRDLVACPWLGGIVLLHAWDADSSPLTGRVVGSAFLGGWSTNPMKQIDGYDLSDRYVFDTTWIPIDEPDDVGWTSTGAGTPTLTSTRLGISTTSQALFYSRSFSGSQLAVRFVVVPQVSSAASRTVFFACKIGNGSSIVEVEVRLGTSSVVVYDTGASSALHTFTIDTSAGVEVCFGAGFNAIQVWCGPRSIDGPRAFQYAAVTASTSASSDTSTLSWGHGLLSTAESRWYEFHYAEGGELDGDATFTTPTDTMPGAPLSPYSSYVASGVSVRAEGGPAWLGDSWALEPRYAYGIERVDPVDSPSPRRGWRSTTDADDVELAWTWGPDHDPGHMMGALVGIGLFNVNFSGFMVQALDSGGTWTSLIGEVSSSEPDFSSMDVAVSGHTVAPLGTSGPEPFLKLNELAGASLYLTSGCVRRIKSNSAGRWSTGAGQQARIILESVDGTEPSTSTTASVIPRDFVLVTRLPSTEIRGLRLLIEGQDTAEGFFQIGTAVIGHVEVFADDYSWGRTIDLEPSVERTVLRGGTSRTRVLAPPKRRVSFGWAEGVDGSGIEGSEPEPDFLTSSSTASSPAVASIGSTPSQVYGLVSLLDSGKTPVVYLPSIPLGSTGLDTYILNRRDELVLAQVVSPVSLEAIQGDECDDEVYRVAQVELEEVT